MLSKETFQKLRLKLAIRETVKPKIKMHCYHNKETLKHYVCHKNRLIRTSRRLNFWFLKTP